MNCETLHGDKRGSEEHLWNGSHLLSGIECLSMQYRLLRRRLCTQQQQQTNKQTNKQPPLLGWLNVFRELVGSLVRHIRCVEQHVSDGWYGLEAIARVLLIERHTHTHTHTHTHYNFSVV
jgi:hypothetical protein